ncbi:MAG: hypothetical protein KC549_18835 [Myxococcales bacterium]|nr:hypothetical protein [Myxococcales bacterium]MCB9550035.1 hypothetical protein [Myxococcales bacterium]
MSITTRALCTLALLFGFSLAGCEGGASCKESCDTNDDCESGLGCFEVIGGKSCLPAECSNCFESGRTCYSDENLSEQAEGEAAMCEFSHCG